ncbi:MAG: adenylate kinase [Alphaproteobacteria bacterium]|nr:adenylate kinase [Alphaproteobacteria bacterium]
MVSLPDRSLIIGNSGSGKTTLARAISNSHHHPFIGLDRIHWEEGGFAQKRDEQAARRLTREAAAADRWVMEGVYGWLSEEALPRAQALLWLDLPWAECRAGLLDRKTNQPIDAELLLWAEQYWTRDTSSSFAGHQRLYEGFAGDKLQFNRRDDVAAFIARL